MQIPTTVGVDTVMTPDVDAVTLTLGVDAV